MQNTRQAQTSGKKLTLLLAGMLLFVTLPFGSSHAHASFASMDNLQLFPALGNIPTCYADSCLPFTRLIDTRDHDDTNVAGERLKKDKSHQKKKADTSKKPSSGAKSRSDEPRGAEDRRDLKEQQHPHGVPGHDTTQSSGSKEVSDQPRGAEDRRDLKEDHHSAGAGIEGAQGKQPNDRRQGGD